jgi:hypothetical protein
MHGPRTLVHSHILGILTEGDLHMAAQAQKVRAPWRRNGARLARLETLEPRQLLAFSAFVNFQPQGVNTPSGYRADTGAVFGNRGAGLSYGWNATNNNAIDRNSSLSPDQRYDTFAQMQQNGNFTWELAVPAGAYNVRVISGDPVSNNAFYHLFAEGQQLISGAPSNAQRWLGANSVVNVTDGRLTISSGSSAVNNKINFIEVTKAAPASPSNLTAATLSATQIRLNWQDNAINEDGFSIERSANQSSAWQVAGTVGVNATTFTDTNLTPSTEYRYRVRSFNDVSSYWFYSNIATAVTQPSAATPAAPTNLVGVGSNVVTLTWVDNSSNEDKFVVQTVSGSGQFTMLREVPANTTSTSVFARSAQINQFRVIARNSTGGDSVPSNVLSVAVKPEAPYSVFAQAVSSSAIDISWDSNDSCQFHVERSVNGQWVRIASDLPSLVYRDTNLPANTQQSYRVLAVAVNEAGDSDPSQVVSATTLPGTGGGPTLTGGIMSMFSPPGGKDTAGEAGYLFERSLDGENSMLASLI